jgi:hypothetical protein
MIQALIPAILPLIDKLIPDKGAADAAKLEALKLAQQGDLAQLDAQVKLALAQAETNTAEARSDGWYKGGWRPLIGYVCAMGLGYQYLARPLLQAFMPEHAFPSVDDGLMELVIGMLGLAGLRTFERVRK